MTRAADGTWQAESASGESIWGMLAPGLAGSLFALAILAMFFFRGGAGDEGVALALGVSALALAAWIAIARAWAARAPAALLPADYCVAAAGLWIALQQIWNPAPHGGMVTAAVLGGFCVAYLIGRLSRAAPAVWRIAIALVVLLACTCALWSLFARVFLSRQSAGLFIDVNNFAAFLSLAAFALAAWFCGERAAARRVPGVLLCTVAAALLVLALIGSASRGGLLGLICGLLIPAWALRAHLSARRLALIVLAVGAGLAAMTLLFPLLDGRGDLLARLQAGGLGIAGQMTGRTVIWAAAWDMLQAAPWHGYGLGTWWLLYPAYRGAGDETAGFHAHNDYLELAAEGGWPLALLVLAGMWCIARLLRPLWSSRQAAVRAEAAWLAGGLLALAVHSVFNFNLYMAPIVWLAGLMCARSANLALEEAVAAAGQARLPLRPALAVVALGLTGFVAYALANAAAGVFYEAGRQAHARGDADSAARLLGRAHGWAPWQDTMLITHADLSFKRALAAPPAQNEPLITEVRWLLDRATAVNPFKPYSHVLRGHLYRMDTQVPTLLRNGLAEAEYRRARALDPFYPEATHALARLLMEAGRNTDAATLLAAAPLEFRGQPIDLLTHYTLSAHAHARAGMAREALAAAERAGDARPDGRGKGFVAAFRKTYGL